MAQRMSLRIDPSQVKVQSLRATQRRTLRIKVWLLNGLVTFSNFGAKCRLSLIR